MEALFFWFFSGAMIICSLAVILCRNPVASALCFAFAIFFMSALFVMLSAFFLAAVQVLVTAGAVMVLFLFIIMLLDITAVEHIPRQKIWMGLTLALALGFIYLIARTLHGMPDGAKTLDSLTATPYQQTQDIRIVPAPRVVVSSSDTALSYGAATPAATVEAAPADDTHQIGRALFTTYVAPFEVTSLLILVATIGVIILSKQDPRVRPAPGEEITREAPPLRNP